jgi:hypothetical protein
LTNSKYGTILPDFLGEAQRIAAAAKSEGLVLKLLGALAFNLRCPEFSYIQQKLGRSFTDIDFASYRKQASKIAKLFTGLGYQEDLKVTTLFGQNRLLFHDTSGNSRHCDVFLDKLEFSHDIPFQDRLEVDDFTVPLAELVLEKMQIVQLNRKDVIDTIMLLREHQVGESDGETINAGRIAYLCARDWGLWKTITTNLERVERAAASMEDLTGEDRVDVSSKTKALLARISDVPKTMSWTVRARIGEKRKWYRDVEELSRT